MNNTDLIETIQQRGICLNCGGDPDGYSPSIQHCGADENDLTFYCYCCTTAYTPAHGGARFPLTEAEALVPALNALRIERDPTPHERWEMHGAGFTGGTPATSLEGATLTVALALVDIDSNAVIGYWGR